MTRSTMVYVHDPRVRWSVPASQVLRIISADDWADTRRSSPAIDVLLALGPAPDQARDARRVLVVLGARDREAALVAGGPVKIEEVDPASVLPLPSLFAATLPQVAAIVVSPDASLSLVVRPERVTAANDSAPPEEPCPSRS